MMSAAETAETNLAIGIMSGFVPLNIWQATQYNKSAAQVFDLSCGALPFSNHTDSLASVSTSGTCRRFHIDFSRRIHGHPGSDQA
jgi:hypothetical protein